MSETIKNGYVKWYALIGICIALASTVGPYFVGSKTAIYEKIKENKTDYQIDQVEYKKDQRRVNDHLMKMIERIAKMETIK